MKGIAVVALVAMLLAGCNEDKAKTQNPSAAASFDPIENLQKPRKTLEPLKLNNMYKKSGAQSSTGGQ